MNILLTSHSQCKFAQYFVINSFGQEQTVTIYRDGRVGVCVHNAANRVWRGAGRNFNSYGEAMAAYKSTKTQSAIAFAYGIAPDFDKLSY